jgi:hypothetical protein
MEDMIPDETSFSAFSAYLNQNQPSSAQFRPKAQPRLLARRGFLSLGILLAIVCLLPGSTQAQPAKAQVNFADIVSTNTAEYATYQVKLTYTGEQSKATPSLLLTGNGRSSNAAEFIPYRSAGGSYANDGIKMIELSVSPTTLQKFVAAVGQRPHLQSRASITEPAISLMIERGLPPNERVFEHLATEIEASEIMNLLQGATRDEPSAARETVRRFRNFTVGPN